MQRFLQQYVSKCLVSRKTSKTTAARSRGFSISTTEVTEQKSPFFYGWAIVGYTFVLQFLAMGSTFYVFGILLKPLSEALEADRFLVSLGISTQMVVGALMGPWLGAAIAKHSIRALMASGIVLLSLGLLAVSRATELWHFYVGFALITSVGFALAGPLPNSALLAYWFNRKRGTAMGISQFGVTFSGVLLVPLFTWIMINYDWRTALVVFAIGVTAIGLPIVLGGIVKTPEEKNLHPDGDDEPVATDAAEQSADGWSMRRAVSEKRVWLIAIVMGSGFMSISAVLLSIHSHMTDMGMTEMRASSLIAAMTFAGALAKPLFGILTDYFDKKLVTFASIAFQFTGVAGILIFDTYPLLVMSAAMFGLGYGAQMPLFNILVVTAFGAKDFPRVIGLMGPIMLPFNMLGLPMATLIYEAYGTYLPAYAAVLVLLTASAICLSFLQLQPKSTN